MALKRSNPLTLEEKTSSHVLTKKGRMHDEDDNIIIHRLCDPFLKDKIQGVQLRVGKWCRHITIQTSQETFAKAIQRATEKKHTCEPELTKKKWTSLFQSKNVMARIQSMWTCLCTHTWDKEDENACDHDDDEKLVFLDEMPPRLFSGWLRSLPHLPRKIYEESLFIHGQFLCNGNDPHYFSEFAWHVINDYQLYTLTQHLSRAYYDGVPFKREFCADPRPLQESQLLKELDEEQVYSWLESISPFPPVMQKNFSLVSGEALCEIGPRDKKLFSMGESDDASNYHSYKHETFKYYLKRFKDQH